MTMTAALRTQGLGVGYGRRLVAMIPDLELSPGFVWLVTGPNGSGKSTLLKTLAGLLPPHSGALAPAPRRGRGGTVFVHSTPVLFRGSLRRNLAVAAGDAAAAVDLVATEFGMADRLGQPVHELSHGMRQRAALARAILAGPAILLLDEPEGGLDQSALDMWRAFATRVVDQAALTLIVAAHRPAGLEGLPVRTIALGA
jgi:ABC-type multidrug transport system ATPase subunit